MSKRDAIFPANRHALYEAHGYSAAVRSGELLFVSGQVGSRDDGSAEPDFAKQVQRAFDNLKAVLAAAGATFDDIIDVTTFHTDPEKQLATIMEIRQVYLVKSPTQHGLRSA
jgi:enamine deaminase RidA (YjgF/YER057c/UK114 family)